MQSRRGSAGSFISSFVLIVVLILGVAAVVFAVVWLAPMEMEDADSRQSYEEIRKLAAVRAYPSSSPPARSIDAEGLSPAPDAPHIRAADMNAPQGQAGQGGAATRDGPTATDDTTTQSGAVVQGGAVNQDSAVAQDGTVSQVDRITQSAAVPQGATAAQGGEAARIGAGSESRVAEEAHGNDPPPPTGTLPMRKSAMDFTHLREMNGDVVAWIQVADTAIDYPVVKGVDNDEYLFLGFDKTYRKAGCLFLDMDADIRFAGKNHPIYGHNMNDGSMFAGLKKYLNSQYALTHTEIYLWTPYGDWLLIPFSVYLAQNVGDYHIQYADASNEQILDRAQAWIQKSAVPFNVEVDLGDRFVTLITCNTDSQDRRVVLHTLIRELNL